MNKNNKMLCTNPCIVKGISGLKRQAFVNEHFKLIKTVRNNKIIQDVIGNRYTVDNNSFENNFKVIG